MGTGLGLATVYGLVTNSGGQITCKSELGRGSVFEVRFPAFPGEAVAAHPERERRKTVSGAGQLILFVDDETSVLEVTRDRLVERGYAVRAARSGEEAIEFFKEHNQEVDLVILDLGMPGMGGRACLEELLKIRPGAKVLISTGYGSRKHEEEALESGACGFLAKPYRISQILSEIEAVLHT